MEGSPTQEWGEEVDGGEEEEGQHSPQVRSSDYVLINMGQFIKTGNNNNHNTCKIN